MSKTFRLALLAEDPNFTVTAPALQQYIQALGLKVELTALPTAPYTDLIQKTNDFEAFLSLRWQRGRRLVSVLDLLRLRRSRHAAS